jgi:hypothetical protein
MCSQSAVSFSPIVVWQRLLTPNTLQILFPRLHVLAGCRLSHCSSRAELLASSCLLTDLRSFDMNLLLFSLLSEVEVEVEVNSRPTVSRPVCLGVRRPSGTRDQFFFLLKISFRQLRVCYFVVPSLTRGRICNLLYNCFWALPDQSLLSRSPAELTAIFYCLI